MSWFQPPVPAGSLLHLCTQPRPGGMVSGSSCLPPRAISHFLCTWTWRSHGFGSHAQGYHFHAGCGLASQLTPGGDNIEGPQGEEKKEEEGKKKQEEWRRYRPSGPPAIPGLTKPTASAHTLRSTSHESHSLCGDNNFIPELRSPELSVPESPAAESPVTELSGGGQALSHG